jgi:hypothetical protein
MSIGIIFGETDSFRFKVALTNPKTARRRDYVKVWHDPEGWVLCQIVKITRSNEKFSEESVFENEVVESPGDKVVAHVEVIGSRDELGNLRLPMMPFSPGDKVFKADVQLIRKVLGLNDNGLYIGMLDGYNIPVYLDPNHIVQKHCSILAKTGSGKSYTAGVILEELLETGIPLLVIDPHGEYASLKFPTTDRKIERYNIKPKGFSSEVTVYSLPTSNNPDADKILRLDGENLSASDIVKLIPDNLTSTQLGILYEAVNRLKKERGQYNLEDIITEVANTQSNVRWSVLAKLEQINESGLFSGRPTPMHALFRDNHASVIDMKGTSPELQQVVTALVCERLFEYRKKNIVPPGMLVIEEAHNFCPERGFSRAVSSDVIRNIASEGRKFGLGLMVISQRPARIDKNVLSQCNTQIILRVTNPNDIQAITKGLEGITGNLVDDIKSLPTGVAVLSSSNIEFPIVVRIRPRRTRHGGESVRVVKYKSKKGAKKEGGGFFSKLFGTK